MDFITGFPQSRNQFDLILVIMDIKIKSVHFLQVRTNFSAEDYVMLYLHEILKFYGLPISIISDHSMHLSLHF